MPNDPNEIRRSLVAERRSLLVTSFVLFFYQAAVLQIQRINLFENEVALSDPWWVSFALWTLWVYFLLRYLQYYMATDTGISDAYQKWMRRIIGRSVFRRFKKSFVPDSEYAGFQHDFYLQKTDFPAEYPGLWSVELEINIAYKKNDHVVAAGTTHNEYVTSSRLLWAKIKAVTCVVLLTHIATEYFLPFIVALLPLGVRLYQLL